MGIIESATKHAMDSYYKGLYDACHIIHKGMEQGLTAYESIQALLDSIEKTRKERGDDKPI